MSNTVKFQQAALFVLVCLTALEAQWQPLPPEDISLTGLAPAVRADTSRKPDGRIVDPDTLAGQVDIAYEGYYRFIPHVWLDSGNEQRNESFYLELHQGDQKILPQDPNVGPYKIILDDTLLYPDENVYIDRDAGLFYLKPGIHDIWMNHYIKVANEYPQFINYYPDGRGMHNAESVFIWQILAIRPEPRVDAAVSIVCTTPEYCFGDPDKTKLVPGDTMIVQVNLMNLMTDGYRNAFPFARLELAIPADLSIFDFSVPPLDGYTAGDKSITWEINQFSDANLQDLTISFKTVSTALNITNPELEFTAEFYVPNDRDIMNNSAQKTVALVEKEPCPTDCYIQLSSDDTDKTVSAGDSITYELIFGNIGPYTAENTQINIVLPEYLNIVGYDPAFTRNGNSFSRFIPGLQPAFADTAFFNCVVKETLPKDLDLLVASASIVYDQDNHPENNLSTDQLNVQSEIQRDNIILSYVVLTDTTVDYMGQQLPAAWEGETLLFRVTAFNSGPAAAENVIVQNVLPPGLSRIQFDNNNYTPGDTLIWNIGQLQPGKAWNVNMTAAYDAVDGPSDLLTAHALVSSEQDGNIFKSQASCQVVILNVQENDIVVSYDVLADSTIDYMGQQLPAAMEGEALLFRLTVLNEGPDVANNMAVKNVLPPGLSQIQFDNNNFSPGDTLTWIVDSLAAGESWSVNMTAVYDIVGDAPALLTAHAMVFVEGDPNETNNRASGQVVILKKKASDIALSYEVFADSTTEYLGEQLPAALEGETLLFRMTAFNAGPDAAENVIVKNALPPGLSQIQFDNNNYVPGDTLTWIIDSLPAGQSWHVNMTAIYQSEIPAVLLTAYASAQVNSDLNEANNQAFCRVVILKKYESDIAVSQNILTDSVAVIGTVKVNYITFDEDFTIRLSIHNRGMASAQQVVVVDSLPQGIKVVDSSPVAAAANGILSWNFETLSPGDSALITLKCLVDDKNVQGGQVFINSVHAQAENEPAENRHNNFSEKQFYMYTISGPDIRRYDLSITYNVTGDTLIPYNDAQIDAVFYGHPIFYQIAVRNNGPVTAHNIRVSTEAPSDLQLAEFSIDAFNDASEYFWLVDSLETGVLWQVEYQAQYDVLSQLDYYLETGAFVTAALDSNLANNSDSTIVAILETREPLCDIWVSLTAKDDSGTVVQQIEPGRDFEFIVDYGNQIAPATDVSLSFFPPPEFDMLAAEPAADYTSGDTLYWKFERLETHDRVAIRMKAATELQVGSYSFEGYAFIRCENEDPVLLYNNSASYSVSMTIEDVPDLEIDLQLFPQQMDVSDSTFVSVYFSQSVLEWDLAVKFPGGQVVTDFGDVYIEKTSIQPERWYKIDQAFQYPNLSDNSIKDEVLFTLEAKSVHGKTAEIVRTLLVTSSNDMFLDKNVLRGGLDDFVEIHFKIAGGSQCLLAIYDLAGHQQTIIDENFYSGGWNMYAWDGRRNDGSYIGSGTYVVTLETRYKRDYKKLIIVR